MSRFSILEGVTFFPPEVTMISFLRPVIHIDLATVFYHFDDVFHLFSFVIRG